MAEVLYMQAIKPNSVSHEYMGQRCTISFDPNAPTGERWVWVMNYVRPIKMFGAAASLEAARKDVQKIITRMTNREIAMEENE